MSGPLEFYDASAPAEEPTSAEVLDELGSRELTADADG